MRPLLFIALLSGMSCTDTQPPAPGDPFPPVAETCNLNGDAAPIPLRRLTKTQIENAISDVIGMTIEVQVYDEGLTGYPANISSSVSASMAQEYLRVAEEIAEVAGPTLLSKLTCKDCASEFVSTYGERLLRRPLSNEQHKAYTKLFMAGERYGQGPAWVLSALLQSPHFLYQVEEHNDGWLDGHSIATRMAFALWDGPPDATLMAAAVNGELESREGIIEQAHRMIDDPKFERSMRVFADHWLKLIDLDDPAARPDLFALGEPARQQMRAQVVELLVEEVRHGGSMSDLLLTQEYPHAPALAEVYGPDVMHVDGTTAIMNPDRRAGLMTTAGVLATLSHANITSPTRRGKVILNQLMCTPTPPPPPGVDPVLPPATPTQTTRERLEAHLGDPSCATCHEKMDGIGFAYEHYDWTGAWRDTENGLEINDASDFVLGAQEVQIDGAVDLSVVLADTPEVATCFSRHWNRHTLSILEPEGDGDCLAAQMGDLAEHPSGLRAAILLPLLSDWFRQANPAQVNQ